MQPIAHYGAYPMRGYEMSSTMPGASATSATASSSAITPGSYQPAIPIPYDTTKLLIGAVAAVAAAGYPPGVPNPLNFSNMINSGSTDAASYASRYQAAYQAAYQNQCYYNGYHAQYAQNSANFQRQASAFQAPSNYGFQQPQQYLSTSSTVTKTGPSQEPQKPSRRGKKRAPSEKMSKSGPSEAKRKEDFDALVKARTEKLLSDGPLFTPLVVSEAAANTSSTSSCVSLQNSGDGTSAAAAIASANARLLRTALNDKVRQLMSCASVRRVFQSRQAKVGAEKRSTDLFASCSTRN